MSEPYHSPTRPRKAAEVVARRIVTDISDRRLPPGTILDQEPDMLAAYGVGRSTLREALRLLETQGVLSLKAGRGPEVRRPTPEYLLNSLSLLLHFQDATMRTLLDARTLFEPSIAAAACRHVTADELAALRANVEASRDRDQPRRQLIDCEFDFHRQVARSSRNVFAETIVATVAAALSSDVFEITRKHDLDQDLGFHEAIADALARRDEGAAARAMREHLQSLVDRVEHSYPALLDQPVQWM